MIAVLLKNAKFFSTCALLRLKGKNVQELFLHKEVSMVSAVVATTSTVKTGRF